MFSGRTTKRTSVNVHGKIEEYEILNINKFNSARKRMRCCIQHCIQCLLYRIVYNVYYTFTTQRQCRVYVCYTHATVEYTCTTQRHSRVNCISYIAMCTVPHIVIDRRYIVIDRGGRNLQHEQLQQRAQAHVYYTLHCYIVSYVYYHIYTYVAWCAARPRARSCCTARAQTTS